MSILDLLMAFNNGQMPGSQPLPLMQPGIQMPEPPIGDVSGGYNVPQGSGNIADAMQYNLGAKTAPEPGLVQGILSNRSQQDSQDLSSALGGTSYGDYAQGVAQSALGKPTLGSQVTSSRLGDTFKQLNELSKAQLYMNGGTGRNGVTIQATNSIMAENPGMSFTDAYSIAKSGLGQGVTYGPDGVTPLPGAANTITNLKRAGAQGTAQGKDVAESQTKLPDYIDNANYLNSQIDTLINTPGLDQNFGQASYLPNIRGGDAANAQTKLEQLKNLNFLAAFNSLRGGGQISNVEGEKAQNAYANLLNAQSYAQALQSLQEMKTYISLGVQRAKDKAGGSVYNPDYQAPSDVTPISNQSNQTSVGEGTIVKNGQGHRLILQGGQWQPL